MKLTAKYFNELTLEELYEILKARMAIFVMEQNIHYQDLDDIDYKSLHCFLKKNNQVVAYLRAYYIDDGLVKIGRVLTLNHGNGLGRILMEQSIKVIKDKMNCQKIYMDAQKRAVGFYEKFDFNVTSDDFLEEGIVHQKMEMDI